MRYRVNDKRSTKGEIPLIPHVELLDSWSLSALAGDNDSRFKNTVKARIIE